MTYPSAIPDIQDQLEEESGVREIIGGNTYEDLYLPPVEDADTDLDADTDSASSHSHSDTDELVARVMRSSGPVSASSFAGGSSGPHLLPPAARPGVSMHSSRGIFDYSFAADL